MNRINYLISLGFDYNLPDGYDYLISNLKRYSRLEDENYPLWLIIRSMGDAHIVDNTLKRYSTNVATIVYDQFFINNKISDIFLELQRISTHKFEFEVIKEFGSTESDKDFWKEFDNRQGKSYFECTYKINNQEFSIRYHFLDYNWLYLNPEFIEEICEKLDKLFFELNINYFSEEFITFFSLPQSSQEELSKDPTVFLNKQLVKKYRKSDFQIQQEKIEQEKLRLQNEELESFAQGKINIRTATKKELNLLEKYKAKKSQDVIISFIGSILLIMLLVWGLHTEALNILPVRVILWLFLSLAILFPLFVVFDSKIWLINKDVKEKKITRVNARVKKVHHLNGKTIINLERGVGLKYIIEDFYRNIQKQDEIVLTVFKECRMYLEYEKINRKQPSAPISKNSNVVLVTDQCPACFAPVGEKDFTCRECGLKFN